MDVVPYITGVYRNKKFNTNRARSGATPLLRGEEENKITGFNIATTENSSLKVTPDKAGAGTAVTMTSLAVSGNDLTFTMPDTANSGYLQLVVNNVKALNNINAYTEYNEEENAKAFDHNTISDDRYTLVWRVTSDDTFKGSKNCNYPAMSKAPNGDTLYASFTNYGQSKTYYTNQFTGTADVTVSTNTGTNNGITTVFYGYDPPENTDISVGADGNVNVFYNANYHNGQSTGWNGTAATSAGGIYVYDPAARATTYNDNSRVQHRLYRFELFTYDDELNQFKNMRVNRTYVSNTAYVNVVYYDRLTNAVKYSYATGGTNTSTNGLPWVTIDGSSDTVDNNGTGFTFAGGWTPKVLTDARYEGVSRTDGTGESIALTATNTGMAVILYMDASTGQLRIARANSRTPNAVTNWKVQGVFASSDENYDTASDYMSCAVDSNGYLHIAFQNTKGQLVYAKSTNAPSDGNTAYTFGSSEVLDDSGMWIDMTMDGTTPYISYLSRVNSYDGMKVAFKDSSFDEDNDGVADTNGGWETMTAPLNAKVTNVRSCIEVNAKAQDANTYKAAVGFCPGADYRAAFFTGK